MILGLVDTQDASRQTPCEKLKKVVKMIYHYIVFHKSSSNFSTICRALIDCDGSILTEVIKVEFMGTSKNRLYYSIA